MINHEFPPIGGGGANASYLLARQFTEMGHQVYVITGHYENLAKQEVFDDIHVHRIFTFRLPTLPWKLKSTQYYSAEASLYSFAFLSLRPILQLIKEVDPDILHGIFLVPSGLPTVLAGKLTKSPTVVTLAGADVYSPNRFHRQQQIFRSIYKYVLKSSDVVTAVSSDIKKRAQKILNRFIYVFPWAVDANKFHPSVEPMFSVHGSVILGVGRLVPRKRFSFLIHAFAKVKQQVPGARLVIVGHGPEAPKLKQLSQKLGIQESVHFMGFISDKALPSAYAMAKVVAIPSYHEGLSLVGLEAIASGKPVVAPDVGGISHWLTSGVTGFICPLNDLDSFADRLITLLTNSDLRYQMELQARQKAEGFNWENLARRYLELYNEAILIRHRKKE